MKYIVVILCLFTLVSYAADDLHVFANQKDALRYQSLVQEIRCVVCQGQNIADSNAPLANDLRDKVAQMINADKSDGDIKEYLVQRYGEFILYKPRVNKLTWLLWGFPFLGIIMVFLYLGRRWLLTRARA